MGFELRVNILKPQTSEMRRRLPRSAHGIPRAWLSVPRGSSEPEVPELRVF